MEYLHSLYIISFLDSFNLGLIMPIINPHLLSIGGTHGTTGLLVSLHCIGQILATTLIKALYRKYNKRNALVYTLIVALISNVILAVSANFWVVFVARFAFYLTNQTQTILRIYVNVTQHNSTHNIIKGVFGALGVAGFLAGPILSGYMFEWNHGFSLVCLLASGVTILSISLVLYLPIPTETESISNLQSYILAELKANSHATKNKILNANIKCNWTIYLLKTLVTASFTAFFMKFSMLLKKHYNASSVTIGYTVAYQSIIMFLMKFAISPIKTLLSTDTNTQLVQILSTSLMAMSAICYAITHGLYMLLYVPLALSRLLLDSMWPDCVFAGRGQHVTDGAAVFTTFTAILVPFLLGNSCDIFDHYAVKVFSIAPLLLAMGLTVRGLEPAPVRTQVSDDRDEKLVVGNVSGESSSLEIKSGGLKSD